MDDFTDPNDDGKLDDDNNTSKVDNGETAPLDDEPSSETHDIDEQLEQFGLKKDNQETIKSPDSDSDKIEEQ